MAQRRRELRRSLAQWTTLAVGVKHSSWLPPPFRLVVRVLGASDTMPEAPPGLVSDTVRSLTDDPVPLSTLCLPLATSAMMDAASHPRRSSSSAASAALEQATSAESTTPRLRVALQLQGAGSRARLALFSHRSHILPPRLVRASACGDASGKAAAWTPSAAEAAAAAGAAATEAAAAQAAAIPPRVLTEAFSSSMVRVVARAPPMQSLPVAVVRHICNLARDPQCRPRAHTVPHAHTLTTLLR